MIGLYGQIPPVIVTEGGNGLKMVMMRFLSHPAAGVVVLERKDVEEDTEVEDFDNSVDGIAAVKLGVVSINEEGKEAMEVGEERKSGRDMKFAKDMESKVEGAGNRSRNVCGERDAPMQVLESVVEFYETV